MHATAALQKYQRLQAEQAWRRPVLQVQETDQKLRFRRIPDHSQRSGQVCGRVREFVSAFR